MFCSCVWLAIPRNARISTMEKGGASKTYLWLYDVCEALRYISTVSSLLLSLRALAANHQNTNAAKL
jgi:hypothetical protein